MYVSEILEKGVECGEWEKKKKISVHILATDGHDITPFLAVKCPHFKPHISFLIWMTYIPFLIVIIGKMGVGIGAIAAIVTVSHGYNAVDGEMTASMGIGAQLTGVFKGMTVWATWVGGVRKGKGLPEGVMVPRL